MTRQIAFVRFLVIAFFMLPVAVFGQPTARNELRRRDIAFDANTFVTYAAQGNRRVVDLFIAAGMDVNARNRDGRAAILLAARDGRLNIIDALLAHGAAVDRESQGRYEDGKTALMFAAQRGHASVVQRLLDAGARVNSAAYGGKTALMFASEAGHTTVVKRLLAKGADLRFSTDHGWTALLFATDGGYVDVVKELLMHGAPPDDRSRGATPLMIAASRGYQDIAKVLLASGARVNARLYGDTALMHAAASGHIAIVRMLLDKKADVNAQSQSGKTALYHAAREGRRDIVPLLRTAGAKDPADGPIPFSWIEFIGCAKAGDGDCVRAGLSAGIDPNVKDETGLTALTWASFNGNSEVVETLLRNGADMNMPSGFPARPSYGDQDWTALTAAAARGHIDVVRTLLASGANTKVTTSRGETALALAASRGYDSVVKMLLEKGAEINPRSDRTRGRASYDTRIPLADAAAAGHVSTVEILLAAGAEIGDTTSNDEAALNAAIVGGRETIVKMLIAKGADARRGSLITAAEKGYGGIVKELIKHGVDVNARRTGDRTALFEAAHGGYLEIVRVLLDNGAEVNVRETYFPEWTPLTAAAAEGHIKIVKLLIAHGADFTVKDAKGRSVLWHAANNGHSRIVELLKELTAKRAKPETQYHERR
jgi:ankyrin repeat protein